MSTLGLSSTGDTMWLIRADVDLIASATPDRLKLPTGLERGKQRLALVDDAERALRDNKVDRVIILEPEPTNQLTFDQARRRLVGETVVAIAAANLDIDCDRMSRKSVRAKLNLVANGRLQDQVGQAVSETLTPNWKGVCCTDR